AAPKKIPEKLKFFRRDSDYNTSEEQCKKFLESSKEEFRFYFQSGPRKKLTKGKNFLRAVCFFSRGWRGAGLTEKSWINDPLARGRGSFFARRHERSGARRIASRFPPIPPGVR